MIKKFLFLTCTTLLMQSLPLVSASPATSGGRPSVRWLTNYEEAVQQSKSSSKPLLLFFTGSDWCGWCNKLEDEAFNTPDFADAAGNRFIFLKLDFPLYVAQDPQLKAQNKQLQQKFDVRSFPTVVLVDPQQNQQIGTAGYRPGGGKLYADYLIKLLNDYSSYKQKMGALDKGKLPGSELKLLYEQAKKLNLDGDTSKIVSRGMDSDQALYFLLERYRLLAAEGQIRTKEAVALKQQLLSADPDNVKQIPYQVAVIEFESFAEEPDRESYAPEFAIAPLTAYIEKFGGQDKDNLWRLQMIVAQVYLDKNLMSIALKYTQDAYESAPSTVRPEIARAVQNISSLMHSPLTAQAN